MTPGILLRLAALVVVWAVIVTLLRPSRDSTDASPAEPEVLSSPRKPPERVIPSPSQPAAATDTPRATPVAAANKTVNSGEAPAAEVPAPTPTLDSATNGASSPIASASAVTKPIPLLELIGETLGKSTSTYSTEALQHQRGMEQEPENEWSQEMEARLREYVATQPEASRVLAQVACRASECLVQLADKVREPLIDGTVHSPSQAIFYRMQDQPWFQQSLQLYNSQLISIDKRPFWFAFFDRKS